MRQTAKVKKNIPLRLAAVLLCLTLFSVYLTAGLFARYTVSGSGADTARVAGFQPKAVISPGKGTIQYDINKIDDYELTYEITVTNLSEVAVNYDLVITFSDDKLNGASFRFNGTTQTVVGASALTFNDAGTLSANDAVGDMKPLKLIVPTTVMKALMEEELKKTAGSEINLATYFTATVTFTQVD